MATTTQSGHRFVAKAAIEPGYDGDGNLTGDGRWDYQWDGENRLTVMTTSTIAQTAGVPYQRLVFSYDGQGRRVRKQVFDSPTGAAIDDLRFLYDGWNLLIEYRKTGSSAPAVLRSYLWGQDLAGIDSSGQPTQGAGGVGGLLGVTTGGNSYLPAYDGNGNIVAWLNSSTQVVCKQEYDPFGNRIIHEGSVDLPIGFSTKYRDEETNLLYYGYRYYDPATGRWPSRDPIEEAGGGNLYGFVGNDGLNRTDLLGLFYSGSRYGEYLPFLPVYGKTGADDITDKYAWSLGKSGVSALGQILTVAGMNHADGHLVGDWDLNEDENSAAKKQTENFSFEMSTNKEFEKWFKNEIYNKFHGNPSGIYPYFKQKVKFHYNKPHDGYTAFGEAFLSFDGNVCVDKGWLLTNVNVVDMQVELSDRYTFEQYRAIGMGSRRTPTAVGYRLQDSGWIRPFLTRGKWKINRSYTFFK